MPRGSRLTDSRRAEVDRLSQALLREFMHRNGCKESLEAFDKDKPRDDDTISSRKVIFEKLHMNTLVKENKADEKPLRSTLEILINFFLDQRHEAGNGSGKGKGSGNGEVSGSQRSSRTSTSRSTHRSHDSRGPQRTESNRSPSPSPPPARRVGGLFHTSTTTSTTRSTTTTPSRPAASFSQHDANDDFDTTRGTTVGHIGLVGQKSGGRSTAPPTTTTTTTTSSSSAVSARPSSFDRMANQGHDAGMLTIEDVDDFDEDPGYSIDTIRGASSSSRGAPHGHGHGHGQGSSGGFLGGLSASSGTSSINRESMNRVRNMLFGNSKGQFPPSYQQGFYFTDDPQLPFGLWQEKGGPCGVLATVQGYLLKFLMDECAGQEMTDQQLQTISTSQRERALVSALAHIIWQAHSRSSSSSSSSIGSNSRGPGTPHAVVAISDTQYIPAQSLPETTTAVRQHLSAYTHAAGEGVKLFIYSVLLSHGLDTIRSEMDDAGATLIGRHSYCTQELVNLFNIGHAYSNVHDDTASSGTVGGMELQGVQEQATIGYLTLFEAHGYVKVGHNLKTPRYPIWILNSESHFSVLFSLGHACMKDRGIKFDLYYFDELGRQDEVIRLTCDARGSKEIPYDPDAPELTPPIDACIRTRWPTATVDWNGTEPFL